MKTHHIVHKDTIALVTAEDEYISVAEAEIRKTRLDLDEYIHFRPLFRHVLSPLPEDPKAPPIARRMIRAAARAGVGPMAAVAGATAESALRAMIKAGARHAVVENGGDIAMLLDRPVTVGVLTGRPEEETIGLRFEPRRGIIAVCTSSGTVGHSLSFGQADAATVVARNAVLADAAATALGNAVRRRSEASLLDALEKIRIPGIEGMLVVAGHHTAAKGRLPEIVRARIDRASLRLEDISDRIPHRDSGTIRPIPGDSDDFPQGLTVVPFLQPGARKLPFPVSCGASNPFLNRQGRPFGSDRDGMLVAGLGSCQPGSTECCSGRGANIEVFRRKIRSRKTGRHSVD